jgi:hypothetical protein
LAGVYRYKPSKPVGVLSVVFGIGMLAFGITSSRDARGGELAFLIFWCCGVVAITGLNAWAAFSEKGSIATFMPFTPTEDPDNDKKR